MKMPKGVHIPCPTCGKDMIIDTKDSQIYHKSPACEEFMLHCLLEELLSRIGEQLNVTQRPKGCDKSLN